MTISESLKKLQLEIEAFATARDWSQFHSPKNLAMALSVECAELLEIFQWLTEVESYQPKDMENLEEEIGDVMIYLTTLAAKFDIDPIQAALKKMELNKIKYPAQKVRGKAAKYDTY